LACFAAASIDTSRVVSAEIVRVAHLTTVDLSLRYLVLPQLTKVVELGGEAIGISASGPYVGELEELGIRHITLPGSTRSIDPRADLKAMVSLWRILREERPDVIHTHTPKPGLYGRVIGRLAGVPAVLNTIHGLYATPDDPLAKRMIVYGLEAVAARFSDVELVQSAEDLRLVTDRRITRPDRTVFLGNGVDLRRFDPDLGSSEERRSARALFGVGDDQIVVGIVARLVAEKGFPELFDAVRGLDDRFTLVVIGPHEPDKADAVGAAMVAQAREDGVVFLGMRDDVDVLYRAMDFFVLPSHREGFPRAAMEAAASGLPLIVTDIRGCREVVEDGVNGLLVPVLDPQALRAAIAKLGNDAELRRSMAKAARVKAVREFDEQRIVRTVIESQVRALRESGRFERLGDEGYEIRPAEPRDARIIARLHSRSAGRSVWGTRGLVGAYRRLIGSPGGIVLVAQDSWGPFAYVAGGDAGDDGKPGFGPDLRPRDRWRSIRPLRAGGLGRAPRTGEHTDLLSIGVADAFASTDAAHELVSAFMQSVETRGGGPVRAVARVGDHGAIDALEAAGFGRDHSTGRRAPVIELWAQTS
jgi:glycosyltransferase involved in cell wall biosynthesis